MCLKTDRFRRINVVQIWGAAALLLLVGLGGCKTANPASGASASRDRGHSPLGKALALVAKPDLTSTEVATFSQHLASISSRAELQTVFEQVIMAVDNAAQLELARALRVRGPDLGQESTDFAAIAGDNRHEYEVRYEEPLACTMAQAAIEPYLWILKDRNQFETDALYQGNYYRDVKDVSADLKKQQLHCDYGSDDYSGDAEAQATCTSQNPQATRPTCPPGWTPYFNRPMQSSTQDVIIAYESGCEFQNDTDRHFSAVEHESMSQFHQLCPGTDHMHQEPLFAYGANARSRSFLCSFTSETQVACPAGFSPTYSTRTFGSSEHGIMTYYLATCVDRNFRPQFERSPSAAAHERRLQADVRAAKATAQKAYMALQEAGANLDIRCRNHDSMDRVARSLDDADAIVDAAERRKGDEGRSSKLNLIDSDRIVLTRERQDWAVVWVRLEEDCRKESMGRFVKEAVELLGERPSRAYLGGGTLPDCGFMEVRAISLPVRVKDHDWLWLLSIDALDNLERMDKDEFLLRYQSRDGARQ